MLDEIAQLENFVIDGREAFLADVRTQYAVMLAYARIGEIAKRLPDDLLKKRPEAEWRSLKGFRDVLIHRYDEVVPERIWEAILKLNTLKAATIALLADLPEEP